MRIALKILLQRLMAQWLRQAESNFHSLRGCICRWEVRLSITLRLLRLHLLRDPSSSSLWPKKVSQQKLISLWLITSILRLVVRLSLTLWNTLSIFSNQWSINTNLWSIPSHSNCTLILLQTSSNLVSISQPSTNQSTSLSSGWTLSSPWLPPTHLNQTPLLPLEQRKEDAHRFSRRCLSGISNSSNSLKNWEVLSTLTICRMKWLGRCKKPLRRTWNLSMGLQWQQ